MSYIFHRSDTDTDLLTGGSVVGPKVDVQKYIVNALDEMTAILGECYETPLPALEELDEDGDTVRHLQFIQSNIATGRLFLAQAGATGSAELNKYGEYLLGEAYDRLRAICDAGTLKLTEVPVRSVAGAGAGGADLPANAPVSVAADSESGFGAFYGFTSGSRPSGSPWSPGGFTAP